MATEKQVEANQANAQRSTGPKTEAGKAVVGRNALRHGLRSLTPVLPDEDGAAFEALRESLIDDMAPEGMLEMALVERMTVLLWRVARASRMESAAMAYERALRLHTAAREVARERKPEPPDWDAEHGRAKSLAAWADWPPPDTEAYMAERGRRYVAEIERYDRLCEERDDRWYESRSTEMVSGGTFHKMLTEPQLLENLARYEVGLYRQFEAALSQFWMVRARLAERREKGARDHRTDRRLTRLGLDGCGYARHREVGRWPTVAIQGLVQPSLSWPAQPASSRRGGAGLPRSARNDRNIGVFVRGSGQHADRARDDTAGRGRPVTH